MKTAITGQLEIDHERGVIYFHADDEAFKKFGVVTALRIGGLPRPIPSLKDQMLDIIISEHGPGSVNHDPKKEAKSMIVTCDWKGS